MSHVKVTTLYCEVPISFTTSAALGGEIQVPTLDGRAKLKNTSQRRQTGKMFRMRGKGVKSVRSGATR